MNQWDSRHMQRALELALRGEGFVEPNPMVGCVIALGEEIIGEGWHAKFGGDHAEVAALKSVPENRRGELAQATLYVTLEPCSHHGKTPPCAEAIINSPIRRVVVARQDPFPEVAGRGLARLREAGAAVEVGIEAEAAAALNAPFETLITKGRPWVIAKWAMTVDGKIATASGDSQWISGEASRQLVHQLRGRVDAIAVGSGTASADDPLLSARPAGARTATRIVFDSAARLADESQLVKTAGEIPVLVVADGNRAAAADRQRLEAAGCEVLALTGDRSDRLQAALAELGSRRMTNLLVEGGGGLLGELFDAQLIDEVYAFIAPKIVGGGASPSPVGGKGSPRMEDSLEIRDPQDARLPARRLLIGDDICFHGRVLR